MAMTTEVEQLMVRIFFGDSRKWKHQPLEMALLERLKRDGFSGATVFRGTAGFGRSGAVHTAHLVDLAGDLPVVIEIVDGPEQIDRLQPIREEMLDGGLVTIEKVRVWLRPKSS